MIINELENIQLIWTGNLNLMNVTGIAGDYLNVQLSVAGSVVIDERYDANADMTLRSMGDVISAHMKSIDVKEPNKENYYILPSAQVTLHIEDSMMTKDYQFKAMYSKIRCNAIGVILNAQNDINTAAGRKEYLCMNAESPLGIGVTAAVLNEDGTTAYKGIKYPWPTFSDGRSYSIDTSLDYIAGLAEVPTKNILYIDWLYKSNSHTSKLRFYNDTRHYKNVTQFLFKNQFGIAETITLTGVTKFEPDRESDEAKVMGKLFSVRPELHDVRETNSGYISQSQYNAFLALAASDNVYILESVFTLPIVIKDISYDHKNLHTSKMAVSVTYEYADKDLKEHVVDTIKARIFDQTYDNSFE